jgi:transcriptional regulator with XRE-family HTH domain
MDQITLAQKVGISKSSMSRILNGAQEPKLLLAAKLAYELGVTLDSLVNDSDEIDSLGNIQELTNDQVTILSIVERLGYDVAIDRLLAVSLPGAAVVEVHEPRPHVQINSSPAKPQVFSAGSKTSTH